MEKEFRLADPGEGIHEAEIVDILVSEGDQVEEDQLILVIETDKAAVEVPSPMAGVIKKISVAKGDTVKVGDVLIIFDVDAEEEAEKEEAETEKEEVEETKEGKTPESDEKEKKKEAETREESGESEEEKEQEKPEKMPGKKKPVPAVPSTRRVARELGVNLYEVEPSGPGGRVTTEDVKAYSEGKEKKPEEKTEKKSTREEKQEKPAGKKERKKPASEAPTLPDFSQWGTVEKIPLRSVRRTIAKRMKLSWSEIPHVTHADMADITELEIFRRKHKTEIEKQGGALTLTIFVIKAAVAALKSHSRFNASLDMEQEEIILKHYYHIGLAVDTDRGLLVPVIRDADRKSITDLTREFPTLADKTRKGEIEPDDMTGGSFTITNVGSLGGTGFTPIINYPQAAILGMAKARLQPVVMGDMENFRVKPRLMLPLVLGFDHRIADGADAARFMGEIVSALENPEKLMMLT
jgi:pyruvate dehydrogenase E2 component (dihydrolipoamide acetyltransferase)